MGVWEVAALFPFHCIVCGPKLPLFCRVWVNEDKEKNF